MPSVQEIVATMAEKKAVVPGKRVRLDFGDVGTILLDGVAITVTQDEGPVDTTIKLSFENFLAMAQGKLNGPMAFMTGKLKIDGDMAVAMQLQSVTSAIKG